MEGSKSNKNVKKCDKKRRKCQHIVEKETGVVCISLPTRNLAICNAGLVSGLTEETLLEHFINYGQIDRIVMPPGKSCCFVSYKSAKSASAAFQNLDGLLKIAQDNKPVYLSYIETIPTDSIKENFCSSPPGLIILENFITKDEEALLLSLININKETSQLGCMKNRLVKHYGYEFRYDTNNVDKNNPMDQKIPKELNFLWSRLGEQFNNFQPDQLTINYYKPGQGIPPHIDTHSAFEDPILSLSLCSSVVMEFKHADKSHYSVLLPRYSLTIMSEESRYDWTHGITPRKLDVVPTENGLTTSYRSTRISFTFRKVRKGECSCKYFNNCDSYNRKNGQIADEVAAKLENNHVHEVYDSIATHFSDTRHKPWPNVLKFVNQLPAGSILVDVGCGNGKYFGFNNTIYEIGCDRSVGLVKLCKNRGFQVFSCNCLNIPIRNEIADGVISIAVIHHLANQERRLQAIKEITRILCVNGQALIYVWAKDQLKDKEKSSYIKQDRKNRKNDLKIVGAISSENVTINNAVQLPVHTNRTQFKHQDILVPWKLKQNVVDNDSNSSYLRYYHVFEEGELEQLCSKLGSIQIVSSYYDQGNWCVILKKIKN